MRIRDVRPGQQLRLKARAVIVFGTPTAPRTQIDREDELEAVEAVRGRYGAQGVVRVRVPAGHVVELYAEELKPAEVVR